MNFSQSSVHHLFLTLNQDFAASKNDLIEAINLITRNTKLAIKNSESKMESCIDAITNDYFEFVLEALIDPCRPIEQTSIDDYNHCLYALYVRANVEFNKILDEYEEEKLNVTKMVFDLKKKIDIFYREIQRSFEEIVENSTPENLLTSLKNHEKIHIRKCNKFKNEVDKLFNKISKKCALDTQEFDNNVNKLIWSITRDHIDILQRYKIVKMTLCYLQSL